MQKKRHGLEEAKKGCCRIQAGHLCCDVKDGDVFNFLEAFFNFFPLLDDCYILDELTQNAIL